MNLAKVLKKKRDEEDRLRRRDAAKSVVYSESGGTGSFIDPTTPAEHGNEAHNPDFLDTTAATEYEFSQLNFAEQGSAPATPSAASVILYAKSDGKLYYKDDAGTEYAFGATTAEATFVAHRLPDETNLDGLVGSGFYEVLNAVNRPPLVASWAFVQHIQSPESSLWCWQFLWDQHDTAYFFWRRSFESAGVRSWTPWRRAVFQTLLERSATGSVTLALADEGRMITIDSSTATTVTVPTHASVPLPVGAQVLVHRLGTGSVTIIPATGVTINHAFASLALRARFSFAALVKRGDNVWTAGGDLTP